jgi:hypothetical protein
VQEDDAAVRAKEEYVNAVNFYNAGNFDEAAKRLGMVTHYIADLAVFGHVMGASTAWGAEAAYAANVEFGTLYAMAQPFLNPAVQAHLPELERVLLEALDFAKVEAGL